MPVARRLERAHGLDGCAVPLLVEVHAMVGHAQSLTEPACLRRHQHRAVRTADGEAFAFLRQRCRSPICKIVWLAVLDACEHAELVAAESVRATLALDRGIEP